MQEPTTPELALATTSDPNNSRPEPIQPKSKPTDSRQDISPDIGMIPEGKLRQLSQTDNEDNPGNQESGTQSGSQSIFAARITARSKKTQEDSTKDDCTKSEPNLYDNEDVPEDEDCFDSLCDFSEGTNLGMYAQEGSWVTSEDYEPLSNSEDIYQISKPLIGTTFNCMSHTAGSFSDNDDDNDFSDLDSFNDEETMSISSFDELEACSEGSSFLENMNYDSGTFDCDNPSIKICSESNTERHGTMDVTGFNEQKMFKDDDIIDSQAAVEDPNFSQTNENNSICFEETIKQVASEAMEDHVAIGRSVIQQHIPTQEEQSREDQHSVEHTHTPQVINQVDCINLRTPPLEVDSETQLDINSDDEWNDLASCSTSVHQTEAREMEPAPYSDKTPLSDFKRPGTQEVTGSRDNSEVDFDLLAEHELAVSVVGDMSSIHSGSDDSAECISAVCTPCSLHGVVKDNASVCDVHVSEEDFYWD